MHNRFMMKDKAWEEVPTGKRPLGRRRIRWRDNISADLQKINIPFDHTIMENSNFWKKGQDPPRDNDDNKE